MFALFPELGARTRPQDLWPFLISETGLKFLIWTQGKIQPGRPGSYEEALSVWNLNIHNRQSNKQVFFSLEFVNILLQMEAKALKNASSLL